MIREGTLEHYVVLMGTQFMLQVKYRKGSMIKFDIYGHTLLLYEVPYIDVPTLADSAMLKTAEILKIVEQKYEGSEEKYE